MEKMKFTFAFLFGMIALMGIASAALNNVADQTVLFEGNAIPKYYIDNNGMALDFCDDTSGFCIPPAAGEGFYYVASAELTNPQGGLVIYEAFIEAISDPVEGTFAVSGYLIRLRDFPLGEIITVTHPYGTDQVLITDSASTLFEVGTPELPGFTAALDGPVDTFLTRADGLFSTDPNGNTHLGNGFTIDPADPAEPIPNPVLVKGAPTGNNFLRVEGNNVGGVGVNVIETNEFGLMGMVSENSATQIIFDEQPFVGPYAAGVDAIVGVGTAPDNLVQVQINGPNTVANPIGDRSAFKSDVLIELANDLCIPYTDGFFDGVNTFASVNVNTAANLPATSDGEAELPATLVPTKAGTTTRLRASVPGVPSIPAVCSAPITVTGGPASRFFIQDPLDVTVEDLVTIPVAVADRFGNAATPVNTSTITLVARDSAGNPVALPNDGLIEILAGGSGLVDVSFSHTKAETLQLSLANPSNPLFDATSTQDIVLAGGVPVSLGVKNVPASGNPNVALNVEFAFKDQFGNDASGFPSGVTLVKLLQLTDASGSSLSTIFTGDMNVVPVNELISFSLTPGTTGTVFLKAFVDGVISGNLVLDGVSAGTNSNATGTGSFSIDTEANTLQFSLTYSGITSGQTAGHIHGPNGLGNPDAVLFDLTPTPNLTAETFSGTWTYNETQENDLLAGRMYINIHSNDFPGGEIRGNIVLNDSRMSALSNAITISSPSSGGSGGGSGGGSSGGSSSGGSSSGSSSNGGVLQQQPVTGNEDSNNFPIQLDDEDTTQTSNEEGRRTSGITGAVTGLFKNPRSFGFILVGVLVLAVIVTVLAVRRSGMK
jgi:uncharacterized membrane protein YgcG